MPSSNVNLKTNYGIPEGFSLLPHPLLRNALSWWKNAANLSQPSLIRHPPASIFMWTDASEAGFGAHTHLGSFIQGPWNELDAGRHINQKEMLAITLALESTIIPKDQVCQ